MRVQKSVRLRIRFRTWISISELVRITVWVRVMGRVGFRVRFRAMVRVSEM